MATREELQDQAGNCNDAASYAALAKQALNEPADTDYAKELLEAGEMSCSFPDHYVSLAEVWVALDKDKAADLYEEAAGVCFEGKEKAEVGYSLALHLGDKDKGRALLEEAIAETNNTTELLNYAAYAQKALQDDALANQLFSKVTSDCKSIADYLKLATDIKNSGNADTARMVFTKAAPPSGDTQDVVEYASGLKDLGGDDAAISEVLEDAESSCMFPAQFVALASGFMNLLDQREKAEELLENGKNFAMTGEENLDLATGYASLLDDQDTAQELYNLALGDFSTKDDILKLASQAATHLEDKSIASQAYDKLADKMTTPADLSLLAQAVSDNLDDKDKVAAIYATAESKADTSAAMVSLAAEVNKNLADAEKTNVLYSKALDLAKAYTDSTNILDALSQNGADVTLTSAVLQNALSLTDNNAQVLDVAQRAQKLLPDDKSIALQALDKAESNVSSLDEMRKLSNTVKQIAADDAERNSRIADKLAKREASQARYIEFQKQEKTLTRPNQFIDLAGAVVEELEDTSYATQLLSTAEEKMQADNFSLSRYQPLILAVGNLLKDQAWLQRLLDLAAANTQTFAQVRSLGEATSTQLDDKDFAQDWTRQFYTAQLTKLDRENASTFEYNKLAKIIKQHLDDEEWAQQVLDKAESQASSHFHFAYLAELAHNWGDDGKAEGLYAKAAQSCQTASQYRDLVKLMSKTGVVMNDALSRNDLGAGAAEHSGKGHYW